MQTQFTRLFIQEEKRRHVAFERMGKFLDRKPEDLIESGVGGRQAGDAAQGIGAHGTLARFFHAKPNFR